MLLRWAVSLASESEIETSLLSAMLSKFVWLLELCSLFFFAGCWVLGVVNVCVVYNKMLDGVSVEDEADVGRSKKVKLWSSADSPN